MDLKSIGISRVGSNPASVDCFAGKTLFTGKTHPLCSPVTYVLSLFGGWGRGRVLISSIYTILRWGSHKVPPSPTPTITHNISRAMTKMKVRLIIGERVGAVKKASPAYHIFLPCDLVSYLVSLRYIKFDDQYYSYAHWYMWWRSPLQPY